MCNLHSGYTFYFITMTNKSVSISSLEILINEVHEYTPKQKSIEAIQYDGTRDMAVAIEESCTKSWVEYDDGNNFCGLRAFTEFGIENCESQYVSKGDYLMLHPEGYYVLIPEYEFEEMYERKL